MSKSSVRRTRPWIGYLIAASVIFMASPTAGEWLVLKDGTRLETDGPWSERGRLVVFTDTSGHLVSIKLADVDLEASSRTTLEAEEAEQVPAPPPPPPRASVFSITDADVGHIDDDAFDDLEGAEGTSDGDQPEATALEEARDIAVTEWEQVENASGDGLAIQGTLENRGADAATGITIVVSAYDVDGEPLGTASAQLGSSALMPGETTRLIADFPGVFDISAVNFEIQQQIFATNVSGIDQ